jgi:hypothetical protein
MAAAMAFDDLSGECVLPSMQSVDTMQAPPSYASTMPTTMPSQSSEQAPLPPPIDIEEDNIGNAGTMNIDEELLFVDKLTQAAVAQGRGH